MPFLVSEESQRYFSWDGEEATVGRTPDNTIQINRPGISRNHFSITQRGIHYVLKDLGSKNGTKLNGKVIGEKEFLIQPGDVIRVGRRNYRFALEPPETAKQATRKTSRPAEEGPTRTVEQTRRKTNPKRPAPRPSPPPEFVPTMMEDDGPAPPGPPPQPRPAPPSPALVPEGPLTFKDEAAPPPAPAPTGAPQRVALPQEGQRAQIMCPRCNCSNQPGQTHCWNCKSPLPAQSQQASVPEAQRSFGGVCPGCRQPYAPGTPVCPHCGTPVGDRHAFIHSSSNVLRYEHFLWTLGALAVLGAAGLIAYFSFSRKQQKATVSHSQVIVTRMDRARAIFAEALDEKDAEHYEEALSRYKEAVSAASEAASDPALKDLPDLKRQADNLLAKYRDKEKEYGKWLEANRERIRAEQARQAEARQQRALGRAPFHRGWIHPEEAGLLLHDQTAFFPEEIQLQALLEQRNADPDKLNALLPALLKRAWDFQANFYLQKNMWTALDGPLPLPERTVTGEKGTRYPEGVSAANFPGVYLLRLPFSSEPNSPLRLQWQDSGIDVQAALHNSTAEAEAATRANDLLTLSKTAKLVASTVTTSFRLADTRGHYEELADLSKKQPPPMLQAICKITRIEDKSTRKEISHNVNNSHFVQVYAHHTYTLTLEILQARWFHQMPDSGVYLPLFLEDEPEGGLYEMARKTLDLGP